MKNGYTYDIASKKTEYKGSRFDSQHEARWAAFFDACGIPWIREPSSGDASVYWVPDFWVVIDGVEYLVEVKPHITSEVMAAFRSLTKPLVAKGVHVLLLGNGPYHKNYDADEFIGLDYHGFPVIKDSKVDFEKAWRLSYNKVTGKRSPRYSGFERDPRWYYNVTSAVHEVLPGRVSEFSALKNLIAGKGVIFKAKHRDGYLVYCVLVDCCDFISPEAENALIEQIWNSPLQVDKSDIFIGVKALRDEVSTGSLRL